MTRTFPARRRVQFVLAGVVFGSVVSAGAAHAQLEVDRLEVFLKAAAGEVAGTFAVRNVTDTARTVTISLLDWRRTIDGVNDFSDPGSVRGSCSPAISVFPTTLLLAGRQSQTVRVSYTGGPRDASCWSLVNVEAAPLPAQASGRAQIRVNIAQGVKVYVEPPDARPMLQLDSIDARRHTPLPGGNPADTLGNDVVVVVSNPGTIQSRVQGRVEYRTLNDSVVTRTPIASFPVLPGASRRVRSLIPTLGVGRYVVLVFLDYGGNEILAGRLDLDLTR